MKTEYDRFDQETAALFRDYDESDWGVWEFDPRWAALPIGTRFWYVRKRMGWMWKASVGFFAILGLSVLLVKARELAEVPYEDKPQTAVITNDTPISMPDKVATTDTLNVTEETVDTTSSKSNNDIDIQSLDSNQIDDDSVRFGLDACKNHIRANALDPNSVRWREMIYMGENDNIFIYLITVQWTNSFGGPAVQTLTCAYGAENGLIFLTEA